ncbi:hypothetical protein [Dactylosporangium sp. NPDC051541]|uniref:hypothetical protein n=1 Tax=Dactylosporangium sp. NPDC051541 TaxID=3363977 RepID=UPI00379B4A63
MIAQWLTDRFGPHAAMVAELAPRAVAAAVERQIHAHEASGLRTRHAYGGAWPAQYEELVRLLRGRDGVEVFHPHGSAVQLVLVGDYLLVPYRYAEDLATSLTDPRNQPNKTCVELLGRYGEPAPDAQPTLSDSLFPRPDGEPRTPDDAAPAGVVFVVFAANEQAGLLRAGLAVGALQGDGTVRWPHIEWLPMPRLEPGATGATDA